MYSLQALWTQAREGLKVITVICANQSYAILQVSLLQLQFIPSREVATKQKWPILVIYI